MAFTWGHWVADKALSVDNMNSCLLGWGPVADFPAAASYKGMIAMATDENNALYYSTGAAWTALALPAGQITSGRFPVGRMPDGTAAYVLTAQGAGSDPAYSAIPFQPASIYGASAVEKAASNAEVLTASETYVKGKEIRVGPGTLRITFDLKGVGNVGYGRVYRNAVAVGTEQTRNGAYENKSEDISGWALGDLCQLYLHGTGGAQAGVQNFKILGTLENAWSVIT